MENLSDNVNIRVTRRQSTGNNQVCLNFKVPMRVRQQFKVYAARHDMTMTELLLQMLNDTMAASSTGVNQENK
jgi:hypothetical protein